MTDFLVVTNMPGGEPLFTIYRNELPMWWDRREKILGKGRALMRELTEAEGAMTTKELAALWRSENRALPATHERALPEKPRGVKLGLSVLAEMLEWPLSARKLLWHGDALRLENDPEGGVRAEVIPGKAAL